MSEEFYAWDAIYARLEVIGDRVKEAHAREAALSDALQTLLDSVERGTVTEGDCNQARAALNFGRE